MSFTPDGAVDAVDGVLATVASLERRHKYRRTLKTLADVNGLLQGPSGKYNASFTTITGMPVGPREFGAPGALGAGVLTTFRLQIELFRGLEDAIASEVLFRNTVFDVLQAFNRRGKFYAAASHQDPMSASPIGYIMLAETVLLHYAVCQMDVRGRTSP